MYRLTVFGGLSLVATDGAPAVGDALQRRLLLVALAAEAGGRGVPRDRAIALLWPDADEERGRGSLNQLRYTLRRQLDAELLVGTLTLRTDPAAVTSDLTEFRDAVAAGDAERAGALYVGPFLDGVPLGGAPELDGWAEACRTDCRRKLEELLYRAVRAGGDDSRKTILCWRRLVALDPLSAAYTIGLMEALADAGDTTAALVAASDHSALARRELGAPADPSITTASARVRNRGPVIVATPAPSIPSLPPSRSDVPVAAAASPHRRQAWTPGRLALLLAAIAGVIGAVALTRRTAVAKTQPSVVAVLPFEVRGGSDYRYLAEGMVTLLSAELDGVQVVRPVDGRAVLSEVRRDPGAGGDPRRARAIAQRLGAGAFVLGDVVEADGRLRLTAAAYRADGTEPVARATVEGFPSALFALVDSLAGRLLAGLGAGTDARLTRLAASTTGSLASLKLYLDGEQAFREGRFLEANDRFRQAAADSTFALANYWLSVSGWWSDQSEGIRPAADLAVRHSERMAPRDRLLLQAWDTLLRGDARESERRYRAVLGVEPENLHASTQLGEVLFHYGPRQGMTISDARPAFERVLAAEPRDLGAMIHLARIAARDQRNGEMQALIDRILRSDSTGEWALEARTLRAYAGKGSPVDERWALGRLAESSDGRIWNEALYAWLAAGNRDGARRIIILLTAASRAPEVRGFGHAALAWLDVAQGDIPAATRQLDLATRYDSVAGLEHRALILALPMVPVDSTALTATRAALQHWNPVTQPARVGASHVGGVHDDSHPVLRDYLLGLLAIRLGDLNAGTAQADRLSRVAARGGATPSDVRDYASRAATSLRAQVLIGRGQADSGVTLLARSLATESSLARMGASPFYSRGLERFVAAQTLERLGRPQEAAYWYATFHGQPLFDIAFHQAARQPATSSAPAPSAR